MMDGGESIKCAQKNGLMISFMIYKHLAQGLGSYTLDKFPFIFSRCIRNENGHRKENGRSFTVQYGCYILVYKPNHIGKAN